MPDPATAAVVIGAIGVISGFLGSKKAARAAKDQAKEEARLEGLTTAERIRTLGREERQLYGDTVARYAGGGVLSSFGTMSDVPRGTMGSAGTVLAEQSAEFARERKITQEVGATRVAQGLARGKATAEAYKFAGYSNAATGISNILSAYAAST
jgi:hypothetical protein